MILNKIAVAYLFYHSDVFKSEVCFEVLDYIYIYIYIIFKSENKLAIEKHYTCIEKFHN